MQADQLVHFLPLHELKHIPFAFNIGGGGSGGR